MSTFTAQTVQETLTKFDRVIRQGVEAGNIHTVMSRYSGEIKQFYGQCRNLSGEAKAVFEGKFFLHGFLREYRVRKNDSAFPDNIRAHLVAYDRMFPSTAAAANTVPAPAPNRAPVNSEPSAVGNVAKDSHRQPMADVEVVSAVSLALPNRRGAPAARRNRPSTPIAGPGPSTMLNVAAAEAELRARMEAIVNGDDEEDGDRMEVDKGSPRPRTFAAIEEEDEEDEDEGEDAISMMDKAGVIRKAKGKGKAREVEVEEEEEEEEEVESDWEQYKRSPVPKRQHPRPARPTNRAAAQQKPRIVRRSGSAYDPPCGTCDLAGKICEKSTTGGACVPCKLTKRACQYAYPRSRSRKVKSKPTVSSDDDNNNSSPSPKRPRRSATAAARTQPSRAAAPFQAVDTDDRSAAAPSSPLPRPAGSPVSPILISPAAARTMSRPSRAAAKKARNALQVVMDVPEEPDYGVFRQVHRRKSALPAARRRFQNNSGRQPTDILAARLELLIENAERALAVPRQDELSMQIRRCEDQIDRLKEVVLDLCEFQGIPAEGFGPTPVRPRMDQLPARQDMCTNMYYPLYRERAVGPGEELREANVRNGFDLAEAPMPRHFSRHILSDVPPSPPPPSPSPPASPMGVDAPAMTADDEPAHPPPMPLPQIVTIQDEPAPPPPNHPPVNLILATPDNSQETAPVGTILLVPTPPQPAPLPPPAPIFSSIHPPIDMDETLDGPPAAAAAVLSVASPSAPVSLAVPDLFPAMAVSSAASTQPRLPRSRSRTPMPALLAAPTHDGIRTRSQTRSPSPAPVAGSKRPADDKSDGDDGTKKRKI